MASRNWVVKEHGIFLAPNGAYYFRGSVPGLGQLEFKLGTEFKLFDGKDRFRNVLREKARKIAEKTREAQRTSGFMVRFDQIADEVGKLKRIKSKATWTSYNHHTSKYLLPWLGKHCPYIEQFNETVWEQYVYDQTVAKPRKLFNDRKHLVSILTYALKKGLLARKLTLRNPDPRTEAGKVYTATEVARLVAFANEQLATQIVAGFTMGMRRKEILTLAKSDVDIRNGIMSIRTANVKTRVPRRIKISPDLLKRLKKISNDSKFFFPSRYNVDKPMSDNKTAWQACKRRAGVTGRFHDLRHSFLTLAFHKQGKRKESPQNICSYAGLDLSVAYRVYIHPAPEHTQGVAKLVRVGLGVTRGGKTK